MTDSHLALVSPAVVVRTIALVVGVLGVVTILANVLFLMNGIDVTTGKGQLANARLNEVVLLIVKARTDQAARLLDLLTISFFGLLLGNRKRCAAVVLTLAMVRAVMAASAATRRVEADGRSVVTRAATLLLIVRTWEGGLVRNGLALGDVFGIDVVPQLRSES